jgi:hypothetical protein
MVTIRHFIIISFCIVLRITDSFSQNQGYTSPKIEDLVKIPLSPEASAFTKYGNTPVNLFRGTADVSIPIHVIQGKELSIPVTLTYDGSGAKVEQIATGAGLGWNLNLGGMIVRQVRGAPDDYLSAQPTYLTYYGSGVKNDYNFVNNFSAIEFQNYPAGHLFRYFAFVDRILNEDRGTRIEVQPDVFTLSALGLSGTIFLNYQTNSAYCIDNPELKITPIFNALTDYNKTVTGWIIVDTSGNTYYFDAAEVTSVVENNSYDGTKVYNSAWSLTRVVSKSKLDEFEFGIGVDSWSQPKIAGRADYRIDYLSNNSNCGTDQLVQPLYNSPTYTIDQSNVSSISYNGKIILEVQSKNRSDLAGDPAIDFVRIINLLGEEIKRVEFIHSYFGEGVAQENLRLRLDSLKEYGSIGSKPQLHYFEYNNTLPLPPSTSFAQDFWGYYNGKTSNTTLIPYNHLLDVPNQLNYNWRGSSRGPILDYAVSGSLKSIKYPTGGSTEFDYGLHATVDVSAVLQDVVGITSFGMVGSTTATNNYNYCDDVGYPQPGYPAGISGGFVVSKSGEYKIKMSIASEGNYVPGMGFAAIYIPSNVNCDQNGNCDLGEAKDFCESRNDNVWSHYGNLGGNLQSTFTITLEAGVYRYLMLNTDPHSNFNVEVIGAPIDQIHEVGGLRLRKAIDRDELNNIKSTRYYYYDDLSLIPASTIEPALLEAAKMETGYLGDYISFEDSKYSNRVDLSGSGAPMIECTAITRYSSNKVQADEHVVYPIVSTIEFDAEGNFNGYQVSEFHYNGSNSRIDGFTKTTVMNGLLKRRRIYNKDGEILNEESTFYRQQSLVGSENGFYLRSGMRNTDLDMYVKSNVQTPNDEFYSYEEPTIHISQTGGGFGVTHCARSGYVYVFFSYQSITKNQAKAQADDYYNQLISAGISATQPFDDEDFSQWVVSKLTYNIAMCLQLGGVVEKVPFSFPRYWVTIDSVVNIQYGGNNTLKTSTKNFYSNINHYQKTRVETKGSDGIVQTVNFNYAHEMQLAEPGNSVWSELVSANRISEPIEILGTFSNSQPAFKKRTLYRNALIKNMQVLMPDKIQLSIGQNALDDKMLFHSYDNIGNILEISEKENFRTSYVWGYDQTLVIAKALNASSNEIFFSSFEFDEGGENVGNSEIGDSHAGKKSRFGFTHTISNITPNKKYILTFWKKEGSYWIQQTLQVQPINNFYNISLSGQVDDVRFYPVGAQMMTYTYQPSVGITSMSDANDLITYYEYDPNGRLTFIRDSNYKIVKQYQYNLFDSSKPIYQGN